MTFRAVNAILPLSAWPLAQIPFSDWEQKLVDDGHAEDGTGDTGTQACR